VDETIDKPRPGEQISIYCSREICKVLNTAPLGGDASNRIHEICDRYLEIVRQDMPSLSQSEWAALIDCLNSTLRNTQTIQHLEYGIRDAVDMDNLADRWCFDGDDLCNRLGAMTYSQKAAIIEAVDRFWSEYGGKSVEIAEALASVGANVAR
jgi:hypothetical protein